MAEIVINEDSLDRVIATITSSTESLTIETWQNCAIFLLPNANDIPQDGDLAQMINNVLRGWIQNHRYSNNAKLDNLLVALDNAGLTVISTNLRTEFGVSMESSLSQLETRPTAESLLQNICIETSDQGNVCTRLYYVLRRLLLPRPTYPDLWKLNTQNQIAVNVTPPASPMQFSDDGYKLPASGDRGGALLLNMIQFLHPSLNREGAIYDDYNLKNLLSKLNYKVKSYNDMIQDFTNARLKKIITDFKADCIKKSVASVVVFVGSHGSYGKIWLSNCKAANLFEDIVYPITRVDDPKSSPDWSKIPKIFIVSACREPVDAPMEMANTVILYSCIPSTVSYRDKEHGTYLVSYLVKEIMANAHQHDLLTMLNKVQADLWTECETINTRFQQTVYETSGDFKKLYFNM